MTSTIVANRNAMTAWHEGVFAGDQLFAALMCEADELRLVLATCGVDTDGRGPLRLGGSRRIATAVAMALHQQAWIALPAAAAIARHCVRICDSALATVDFAPNATVDGEVGESDPFMLFAPHASEAVAVPAIDEFIDVFDGRRICWRRPRRDARRLAVELQRLSEAVRKEDTPALQEEYLELLASLHSPAEHVREWIGTVADDTFMPAPDRFAESFPAMRQGLDAGADPSRFAEAYGTRISVNISIAARSLKRRMLGLEVTDPFHSRPRRAKASQGVSPTCLRPPTT